MSWHVCIVEYKICSSNLTTPIDLKLPCINGFSKYTISTDTKTSPYPVVYFVRKIRWRLCFTMAWASDVFPYIYVLHWVLSQVSFTLMVLIEFYPRCFFFMLMASITFCPRCLFIRMSPIHFYPRPALAFGYCRCLRLSVCVSVCVCGNHMLVRAITHHPFELGSPNFDHRCKRPRLRPLLFWGVIDLDLQCQI